MVHQAVAHLIQRVKTAKTNEKRLLYRFQSTLNSDGIDWMDAQSLFPKFYWQSRDAREEVVAIGQLEVFHGAQISHRCLSEGQRLWGGSPFASQSCLELISNSHFFVLPLVELIREGAQWSLAVNLNHDKHYVLARLPDLVTNITSIQPLSTGIKSLIHCPDKVEWSELVAKVLAGIDGYDFKKVVLARKTLVEMSGNVTAAELLKSSYLKNHNSFHFMFAMDNSCSFIGSSPERLYLKHGQNLYTEALAGTVGRGENSKQDMKLGNWLGLDTKNINENGHVVDDIVESLTPYSTRFHIDQETHLVKLSKVQHLKRDIHAFLKPDVSPIELLRVLQPTAAVAGLPRKESIDFIQQNEPFSRGWYAGSFGFIGSQHAEFCVAIRSALVQNNEIELFSGAGIVAGSVACDEWDELDKKLSTLLSLLDKAPDLEAVS
ncbi:isochorismate synthase [Vibrio hepatarius]|uniref:isochorismate synthase n=1 Tax=Vibrio hepatarius TaxID=171383 RepID=UPI001C09FCEA|nr:isochorismate synthase [Vibrio hepatarius]MBU2897996.1 isochorismate synthase [Vibrio hepatarius]